MKALSIRLLEPEFDSAHAAFPIKIYDLNGDVLAETVTSTDGVLVELPSEEVFDLSRVHVVGTLPNGRRLYETIDVQDGRVTEVVLTDHTMGDSRLNWLKSFQAVDHLSHALTNASSDSCLKDIWLVLWRFREGNWTTDKPIFEKEISDDEIYQIVLDVPDELQLLQAGGSKLAWRLIALPPGGRVRVALAHKPVRHGDESVQVTVSRAAPSSEHLISYLSRGDFESTDLLAKYLTDADAALYQKNSDTVAAVAGAYVMYRLGRLQDRVAWLANLRERFPYLADGCVLTAALILKHRNPDLNEVRRLIYESLERGLPLFRLGLSILVETMTDIHRGFPHEHQKFHQAYVAAQAYLGASVSDGAYTAFFGRSPVQPSWHKDFGDRRLGASSVLKSLAPSPSMKFGGVNVLMHSVGGDLSLATHWHRAARLYRAPLAYLSSSPRLGNDNSEMAKANIGFLKGEAVSAYELLIRDEFDHGQIPDVPSASNMSVSPQTVSADSKGTIRRTRAYWRRERIANAVDLFADDSP